MIVGKLASQLYSAALYTLCRGCALWIPEPNEELPPAYRQIGVRIGDVGILRADGSFDFIFNVCYPADHEINSNYGVPDDFEQIEWNGRKRVTRNYFRPGEPILSRGAKKQVLDVGGSVSIPGMPVGGGAGLSIKFSKDRGAVILPPNGADSIDCQSLDDFFDYAQRHGTGWYKFVNEKLRMQVENGALYLVTGFDKTNCWENAVFSHNLKERAFEIIVNTGGLAGGDGRFQLSDSSLREAFSSRCSPSNNVDHNQALFVRGFRISMHHKLKTFFGRSPIEVTSTYDSLWKDIIGKKSSQFSFRRGGSSSSGPRSPSSGSSSSRGRSSSSSSVYSDLSDGEYDSDTSLEEDDDYDPSPEVYDPSQVVNNYILRSISGRDDVKVVITHDEDWFAVLTDEDVEMPDEEELLRRLKNLFRVTVKDGCASMKHVEDSLDPSELDRTCSIAADSSVQTDFINNVEPSPPQDDLVRASFVDTSPLASAEHGGHALRVPEPNKELTAEYRQTGVRIGDVGILRDDGSFDFVFNVCCSANDPINQYGVPTDFQTLSWNGAKRRMSNIFRPGEPVLSRGAKKQALGVEGTASVPGIPVGGGAGWSTRFSKDQGAVIIPPNGVDSVDCQDLAVFRNYAERHAVSWHSFVNEELGMEVENGTIYFVTGFDKTDCWENAVFSHNLKERTFGIIVNTGSLAGDDGRLHLSDSSLCEAYQSRCSPAHNLDRNQPLFVRHLYVHQLGPRFPRGTSSLSSSSVYSDLSVLNVAGDQYRVLGDFKRNGKKSAIENVSRPGEPLSNCDAETLGFEGTAPLEFGDPSPQYWMVQAQRLQPPAHTLRAQDPDCLRDAEAKARLQKRPSHNRLQHNEMPSIQTPGFDYFCPWERSATRPLVLWMCDPSPSVSCISSSDSYVQCPLIPSSSLAPPNHRRMSSSNTFTTDTGSSVLSRPDKRPSSHRIFMWKMVKLDPYDICRLRRHCINPNLPINDGIRLADDDDREEVALNCREFSETSCFSLNTLLPSDMERGRKMRHADSVPLLYSSGFMSDYMVLAHPRRAVAMQCLRFESQLRDCVEVSSLPFSSSLSHTIFLPSSQHSRLERQRCRMQCRNYGQEKPEENADGSQEEISHAISHGCGSCECKFSTNNGRGQTPRFSGQLDEVGGGLRYESGTTTINGRKLDITLAWDDVLNY